MRRVLLPDMPPAPGNLLHERANYRFLPGLSCDGATRQWKAVAESYGP